MGRSGCRTPSHFSPGVPPLMMEEVVCGAEVGTRGSKRGKDVERVPAEDPRAAGHSKHGAWLLEQASGTGEMLRSKGCFVPLLWSPGDPFYAGRCLEDLGEVSEASNRGGGGEKRRSPGGKSASIYCGRGVQLPR
ncbi:hypothetical protein NDU88_005256 [Pleurodeles waltl]|uniref:Uncharacterized protein n=1 Tax=Pleurodeles waltl TaxID=8319 RepID=A0AAV7MAP2_PLEWA|nr:hypothetical protein NDU88_005256 [Pleurodeles waltl]